MHTMKAYLWKKQKCSNLVCKNPTALQRLQRGPRDYFDYIVAQWGHAVVRFVEVLRHKSEGREFDSRCYHCLILH